VLDEISGNFLGVSVLVGANGVKKILEFELSQEENDGFALSVDAVRKQMEITGLHTYDISLRRSSGEEQVRSPRSVHDWCVGTSGSDAA